ncbi:WD40 repeat domain-containing protein [Chloropicon primus]|uniref:WD40 repeat domain-containing protein n=1 Tax=Chloropicon primus TaxID=1764295 RepID=A0A5B8MGU9_9CHLO|nr:WD40 repeat domain-containing protein [Chloropicon primus]UPQ98861.1 WD40 repeat domain-containing protein [Chloropicon primus]|eukprot:QDZ19649.1 WD40 repeat domain-containing protein [Chloropicon primus]
MKTLASPFAWLRGPSGAVDSQPAPEEGDLLPRLPNEWKTAALVVILDFLQRQGYSSAAVALENETGIQAEELEEDLCLVRSWILQGSWSQCYEYLSVLGDGSDKESVEGLDVVGAVSECKKAAFFELLSQKDKPTPVNELVDSLEDIEKTCTTECFNEACYCMSLSRLQDNPKYESWTREKGRADCFAAVRKCLEYTYNRSPRPGRSAQRSRPSLELILRRSRAWLEHRCHVGASSGAAGRREDGLGSPSRSPKSSKGGEMPGADYESLSSSAAYHTDELIDLCDKLNEKAEILTQSNDFGAGMRNGGRASSNPNSAESPGLRGKIRDISNSKNHSGCMRHHHDLPCSPGYLAEPKTSPKVKKISPRSARRQRSHQPKSPQAQGGQASMGNSPPRGPPATQEEGSRVARALSASFAGDDSTTGSSYSVGSSGRRTGSQAEERGYGSADISRGFVCQEVFKDSHPIRCLSYCDGSNILGLGCNKDKALRAFQLKRSEEQDKETAEEIFTRKRHHEGSIYCMEWKRADDRYLIATGSNDHQVKVLTTFDFRGDSTATLSGHDGTVRDLSISNSGKLLASGGAGDNAVRLWDIDRQQCVGELFRHESMVTGVGFSKQSEYQYFSGDAAGSLLAWDARSDELSFSWKSLQSGRIGISSLAVSGTHYIGVGYSDGCFQLLDARKSSGGEAIFEKFIHSMECRSLDFSPDDAWLLSASFDSMSHVVSVVDGSLISSSRGHSDKVVQGKWNPSKVQFATCCVDGTVKIHEPRQPLVIPQDLIAI